MLNIEDYDKWSAVCDDDDLIQILYDQGIRPGTKEFEDNLGIPLPEGYGKPTGKDYLQIAGAFLIFGAVIFGGYTIVKTGVTFGVKKIKEHINKKKTEKEES